MYEMLVRKTVWEGKRSGIFRHGWEDNIKIDLGWGRGDDCIYPPQVRVQ